MSFWGEGVWLNGTERDMGGVKNVHFLGDVLNGCSLGKLSLDKNSRLFIGICVSNKASYKSEVHNLFGSMAAAYYF